jgi:hypothetical protein
VCTHILLASISVNSWSFCGSTKSIITNTVHVGYSVHGYSGQPVIVAILPGTEFLHSIRLPPVIVAIFGWSQGGHYNRRVLYKYSLIGMVTSTYTQSGNFGFVL